MGTWKNYVSALEGIGAKLISKPDDHNLALLGSKSPKGEQWYLYEHRAGNEVKTTAYSLTYVQAGGPPLTKCVLEVHGINFDFDKATARLRTRATTRVPHIPA